MGANVNNEQFLEHLLKVPLFPLLPPLSPPFFSSPFLFLLFPPSFPLSPPRREELSLAWHTEGDDTTPFMWHPEYDKPLGTPTGPAKYEAGVWTRSFASGTEVMFNTTSDKGTIKWGLGK